MLSRRHYIGRLLLALALVIVNGHVDHRPVSAAVSPTNEWVNVYGQNTFLDGQPIPVGAVVRAFNPRGIQAGEFTVTQAGSFGLMPVYRDDPGTAADEGLLTNETISFTINGRAARVDGPDNPVWTSNGALLQVNLSVSAVKLTNEWVNFYSQNTTVNGVGVPVGTLIEAFDPGGTKCGETTVDHVGWYGLLACYRDDSATPEDEGANPGDAISFKVGGVPATATGPATADWTANGDIREVNLVTSLSTLQFTTATLSVLEGVGQATLTVSRAGNSAGAAGVSFATANGTATAGSDYSSTSGTLTWTDGDTSSKTINVSITDDTAQESNETFTVTLSNPTGSGALGSTVTATVTILANDAPVGTLQFTASTLNVSEGIGTAALTVSRVGGSAGAIGVSFSTANGTATAGSDYTATSGTLSWADGDAASKTISVPITDDAAQESNETFTVTLNSPTGGATLGTPSSSTVTILANDGPIGTLQFSAAALSVAEGAGQATLTVSRVGGSTGAVGVSFTTANGTATAGSDYTLTAGTLSWADGDTSSKTISVPILDDAVQESDETFTMSLSSPTGGAALGTPASATITILANDQPRACDPRPPVTLSVVRIGAGTLQVTVTSQVSSSTPSNQLTELRFGTASNALIDIPNGPSGFPGNRNIVLSPSVQQTTFRVRRINPGAFTAHLDAIDACPVPWRTFVGGGPSVP